MWALFTSLLPAILKLFGLGGSKSDAEIGLDKGEKLGQAETKAATDDKIIQEVSDAGAARQSVRDAPPSELRADDGFKRSD